MISPCFTGRSNRLLKDPTSCQPADQQVSKDGSSPRGPHLALFPRQGGPKMSLEHLPEIAGAGATVVLYLLIALSVAQLAVILERGITFFHSRTGHEDVGRALA